MRKITKVFLSVILGFLLLVLSSQSVFAAWDYACFDPDGKVAKIKGFECIVKNILNIAVRFAGIAAFIMIIIGGFQYLTSGGNPENTKKAQGTITWGIAGLAILLGSWLILKFIQVLTNVDVTQFVIPTSPESLPLLMK